MKTAGCTPSVFQTFQLELKLYCSVVRVASGGVYAFSSPQVGGPAPGSAAVPVGAACGHSLVVVFALIRNC